MLKLTRDHGAVNPDARELRQALTDLPRIIAYLGLEDGSRREGNGIMVRCPAHAERTPSCSITLGQDSTLRVRCFGCDLAGDIFYLIAAVRGLDVRRYFPRVIEEAARLAGWSPGWTPPPTRPAPPTEPPPLPDELYDAFARDLLARCPMDRAPDVAGYLRGRGILDAVGACWGALPALPVALAELREDLIAQHGAATWQRSGLAHVHTDRCRADCRRTWDGLITACSSPGEAPAWSARC